MMLLCGPNISGNEWQYVKECLDTAWVSSVGKYVDKFEQMVAEYAGAKFGVAAVNGTSALHIALILVGVKRNDYVITPNITFIASLNSIKYTGANPILIDVDYDTWQMDLDLLEEFLATQTIWKGDKLCLAKNGRRISAIMPVHVLGNICDMDRFMSIVNTYKLKVVEDTTEALGSKYKGKMPGTFGEIGCFSFNGNKIITTGGGGVIVTNDEKLAKRAKHLTTQAKSDPMEYIHDEIGYNYRLVNVLAAMGVAQMEQLPSFVKRKQEIADYYIHHLKDVADFKFQKIDPSVESNQWLFTFQTKYQKVLLKHLNSQGLQSRPFWQPMNKLKMFKKDLYFTKTDVSHQVYEKALSIPCSSYLTNEDLDKVIDAIKFVVKKEASKVENTEGVKS
jgi:perosamine synthetase